MCCLSRENRRGKQYISTLVKKLKNPPIFSKGIWKIVSSQRCSQQDDEEETKLNHRQAQHETASFSGVSSSDDESNISLVSTPDSDSLPESSLPQEALKLAANRPLPEKGKLLLAVKDCRSPPAEPSLAGPLPQWQHPPPQLASIEIPPVSISSPKQQFVKQESFNDVNGCLSKKRSPEL
ncbi:hypothetical protein F3Y22_tig00112114pilonHSYRG00115 [Hibiscus syriacus]|uniref:Uncharacterized protein n=1 Tax=Hibiscus syriacus TaxID=106335 RepID=A0A6A2X6C3_HIBSY|nr:hypothetical protein F3Y22_tig00112114pilonHSYRG00115 [Hibiscus syriacus]